MYYDGDLKGTAIFKYGNMTLTMEVDLEQDIYDVMCDLADALTVFTFADGSIEKVKDILQKGKRKHFEDLEKELANGS